MSSTIHVFEYLDAPAAHSAAAVCVLFGDEAFLKRLALKQLIGEVVGDDETPFATFDGTTVQWRNVADELSTVSLFGSGRRLAVVDKADDFVKQYRSRLEDYVDKPHSHGVLVMDVTLWQSNTRLYKAVNKRGLQIECRAPLKGGRSKALDERRLAKWVTSWAHGHHGAKLLPDAAAVLLELVGPEFGILDQELAKLALFTKPGGEITPEMVRDVVGGWKTKDIWELMDAACDGNAGEALTRLDRLLQVGESPQALFGQMAWTMRRFAAATRAFERAERSGKRMPLSKALQQAGFRAWPASALTDAEKRLKQLGRHRTGQFYRWLLEADLALKLSHSSPQRGRLILETLLLRMAKQLSTQKARR